jgi:hypothetical protein
VSHTILLLERKNAVKHLTAIIVLSSSNAFPGQTIAELAVTKTAPGTRTYYCNIQEAVKPQ